jgi:anti-sigma factor RsiW
MNCERCNEDLTAYLDGELTDARKRELKSHLESCVPCREEFQSLEESQRFFERQVRELEPASETWNRVRTRIAAMEPPAPAPGLFQLLITHPWWSAAVTAVATAALAIGFWGYVQNQTAKRDLMQYMTQYIQQRDAQEHARRAPAPNSSGTYSNVPASYSDDSENPFVTVNYAPDKNPFRSEDLNETR